MPLCPRNINLTVWEKLGSDTHKWLLHKMKEITHTTNGSWGECDVGNRVNIHTTELALHGHIYFEKGGK